MASKSSYRLQSREIIDGVQHARKHGRRLKSFLNSAITSVHINLTFDSEPLQDSMLTFDLAFREIIFPMNVGYRCCRTIDQEAYTGVFNSLPRLDMP
jgi:hypothetical protein